VNVSLLNQLQIQTLKGGQFVFDAIKGLADAVRASWDVEHADDGTHKNVTASGNVVAAGYSTFTGQTRCFVYKSGADQSIATGTDTFLTFDTPVPASARTHDLILSGYDPDTMFDGTSNFLPPVAGLYLVTVQAAWALNTTGIRKLMIYSTQTDQITSNAVDVGSTTSGRCDQTASIVLPVDPGENCPITVAVYQNSGGALAVSGNSFTWCQVTKIG